VVIRSPQSEGTLLRSTKCSVRARVVEAGDRGGSCGASGWSVCAWLALVLAVLAFLGLAAPVARADVGPSGEFRTNVHIAVPAFHRLEPRLDLAYSSRDGNGWLGTGWRLAGLSEIDRRSPGNGAPKHNASDVFFLDGTELVPCTREMVSPSCRYPAPGGLVAYTTWAETYRRIAFDPSPAGGAWYVWDKDGRKTTYTPSLTGPLPPTRVFNYHVARVEDTLGNRVSFSYAQDEDVLGIGQEHLRRISYTGTVITFHSESRPDVTTAAVGGSLLIDRKRLRTIDIEVGGERARAYALRYSGGAQSVLTEVQQYGRDATLSNGKITQGSALEPVRLTHESSGTLARFVARRGRSSASGPEWNSAPPVPIFDRRVVPKPASSYAPFNTGDVDADGRADWTQVSVSLQAPIVQITTAFARPENPAVVVRHFAWPDGDGFGDYGVQPWSIDLDGDGSSDQLLISEHRTAPSGSLRPNRVRLLGGIATSDGALRLPGPSQVTAWEDAPETLWEMSCQTGDVNGDGMGDLLCAFTREGHTRLGTALSRGDGTFRVVDVPAPNLARQGETPQLAVGDLDADGLTDAYLVYDGRTCPAPTASCDAIEVVTARSLGNGGYALSDPRATGWREPGVVAAPDVTGDGRADLVRFAAYPGGSLPAVIQSATPGADGELALHEQKVPGPLIESGEVSPGLPSDADLFRWTFGDADGDGRTDLLVISPHPAHGATSCSPARDYRHAVFTRFFARGDGTFRLRGSFGGCKASRDAAVRWNDSYGQNMIQAPDVNGDGLADFVVAADHPDGDDLTVSDDISINHGRDAVRWTPADLNGDERTDFVYVHPLALATHVHALVARSSGGFQRSVKVVSPIRHNTVARSWKVFDVDGDGLDDVVHVEATSGGTAVRTLLADGNGAWRERWRPTGTDYRGVDAPNWLPLDVNGDGRGDLVHVGRTTTSACVLTVCAVAVQPGLRVHTLVATADGGWTPRSEVAWPNAADGFDAPDTTGWRSADVNGDGRGDLVHLQQRNPLQIRIRTLLATGDGGWLTASDDVAPGGATGATASWRPADVNADGKTDLVSVRAAAGAVDVATLLSLGDGAWKAPPPARDVVADSKVVRDALAWKTVDLDGDSRANLVHTARLGKQLRIDALAFAGAGGWRAARSERAAPAGLRPGLYWKTADLDGDARGDLVQVDVGRDRPVVRSLLSRAPRELVTRVANGMGAATAIRYGSPRAHGGGPPGADCLLPAGTSMVAVARVTERDGVAAWRDRQTYGYGCPRWSHRHRRLLGWKVMTAAQNAAPNRPALISVNRFMLDDKCLSRPHMTGLHTTDGEPYRRTLTAYDNPGDAPPYRCAVMSEKQLECGEGPPCRNADVGYRYDEFGNVTHRYELGAPTIDGDERTTVRSFHRAVGPYIVGLPSWEGVHGGIGPVTPIHRGTAFCYDGDPTLTCEAAPTKGQLTARKQHNLQGLGDMRVTTYEYDAFGNRTLERDARGNATRMRYDDRYHTYLESSCNALAQCTSTTWDPVIGQRIAVKDINGRTTSYGYDALGRLESTTQPGGGVHRRYYLDWGKPRRQRVREVRPDGSADGLWSETYLDGLGRTYRVRNEGDVPGKVFVQRTEYSDASERIARQTSWFRPGSTNHGSDSYSYDGAGRVRTQTHADGARRSWEYGAEPERTWIRTRDEEGRSKTVYRDAYDRPVRIVEHHNGQPVETQLSFNAVDELRSLTDPAGNVTRLEWDNLGNRTAVDDPDLGRRTFTYDRIGNLETQTDARSRTLTFTHDALNRVTTKRYPTGALSTWRYDEPGHGAGRGRLTSVSDTSGNGCPGGITRGLRYGARGNVTSQTTCIEGQTRRIRFRFDALDRQTRVVYPDGERVPYGYDSAGRLERVGDYATNMHYDPSGLLVSATYGNGTTSKQRFDPRRGWLTAATVRRGRRNLYNARYRYQPDGLLESSTSTTNRLNSSYVHDDLGRLTDLTGDLAQDFQYDNAGNLTFNSRVGVYTYPTPGPTGCGTSPPRPCATPHGVTRAGTQDLRYDLNGNLSSIYDPQLDRYRGIDWTDDHRPAVVSDFDGTQTHYVYDADGHRVARHRGGDVTRWHGDLLEESTTRGSRKNYLAGPTLLARRGPGGAIWYHRDHLGSPRLITSADGTVMKRYDYRPFGEAVDAGGTLNDDLQFGGHRREPTGLLSLPARDYDPHIGRFISPDVVTPDPSSAEGLNRYSYTRNDPSSLVDRDGHDFWSFIISLFEQEHTKTKLEEHLAKGNTGPEAERELYRLQAEAAAAREYHTDVNVAIIVNQLAFGFGDESTPPTSGPTSPTPGAKPAAPPKVPKVAAPEPVVAPVPSPQAANAQRLQTRATEVHAGLDPIAQEMRTTAAIQARKPNGELVDVLSAGAARDLSPGQRAVLRPGELAAKLPGADAEMTGLSFITKQGWDPVAGGISRDACPVCRYMIEASGGVFINNRQFIYPQAPPPPAAPQP
jgi:RHS repeat-associated protein